jgi:hypothetical protein
MTRPTRRRFRLDLRDAGEADDVDVIHRLRSLLKAILRGWHIRCTRAIELHDDEQESEQAQTTDQIQEG